MSYLSNFFGVDRSCTEKARTLMSELRFESLVMPAADLGPETPFPPLQTPAPLHVPPMDASLSTDEREGFAWGMYRARLPYGTFENYNRVRKPRTFKMAVLENTVLKATFLLELGGRLWSLIHKPTGRELLYVNPVFQPANLAKRNAWFSGGVEWNGIIDGHSPFTCIPVFAARLTRADGTPILRIYEWERARQLAYQIDFCLPEDSSFLLAQARLTNPHADSVPVWWWSNIAVPQSPGGRVLAPASAAVSHAYTKEGLGTVSVPVHEATDLTRPETYRRSQDIFFRIPEGHRPWIAALDKTGAGLVHTSTARLKGRKLFVWGMGRGGSRWQDFLTDPGHPYIEIQAGLCRHQAQCISMPAGADWSWTEAYGLAQIDPGVAHGSDWERAVGDVERFLDAEIPAPWLENQFERGRKAADRQADEILQQGSGWGALERIRREHAGEPPPAPPALGFSEESLTDDQTPWLALLRDGALPYRPPEEPATPWIVQDAWRGLLEQALRDGKGDHWLSWQHLGVMRFHAGDIAGAKAAWKRSMEHAPSVWALRNLAVVAAIEKQPAAAVALYEKAAEIAPQSVPLAVEHLRALLKDGRPAAALAKLNALPPAMRCMGRIQAIEARVLLYTGDLDGAERVLRTVTEIDDLREGENVLTDVWFAIQAKRIIDREGVPLDVALAERLLREALPPPHIDFRMVELPEPLAEALTLHLQQRMETHDRSPGSD